MTNHAPPFRVGAFQRLHEREDVTFALIGGELRHGGGTQGDLPFPVLRARQVEIANLAASGRYRAVIAGLSGRVALPAAWAGARRARVPFVLWATIWAHPRTPAHALSYLPLRRLYRAADAVVTYGPHVSAYVKAKGARGPVVEAPQAVDNAFWSTPANPVRRAVGFQAMFSGRLTREKGVAMLYQAWRASGLSASAAALVLVGGGPFRARAAATGADLVTGGGGRIRAPAAATNDSVIHVGPKAPEEVRNFYAGSDVVVVPSIPTRDFREPWGLVVNEAFNQGIPVIATDAVGAAAGGLVRHEDTGLVVPAGDVAALAGAIRRLHEDQGLRARLGARARAAVGAYTHDAWAAGMSSALAAVGASAALPTAH